MINLAALFVLSPSRSSSASSRCLQARPNPSVHPAPSTTPPPAFRHPANASLCFAPMFKGLQAGNLLRLSGAKLCRRRCLVRAGALLRVCRVSWCSNGTMQCLCCVSGCCRGRGCKEGAGGTLPPAVLVRKFVSGCAVRAEVRLWAGSQPLGSLALARFGRGYRQNENETNVRHSVRSETPKVRHS